MICDVCGTKAQPASSNQAFRCLNCGTLMNVTTATAPEPPPVVVSASNHSYSTPHGKLSAQVQGNGTWTVAVSLTPATSKSDATAVLVKNLLSSWATLNDAALPTLRSFAAKELRMHLDAARFRRVRAPGGTSPATRVRRSEKARSCAGRATRPASSAEPGRL